MEYRRAYSIDEAVGLLNEAGVESRLLAGGTDMLIQMRRDEVAPCRLVDVLRTPELREIEVDAGKVIIGSSVTFSQLLTSEIIKEHAPILAEMAAEAGAVQLRNMGTIGGNVANAALAADSLPVLIALDAAVHLVGKNRPHQNGGHQNGGHQNEAHKNGGRVLPLVDFVTGPGKTQLQPGELITAFSFPIPGGRSSFIKVGRRNALNIARLSMSATGILSDRGEIVSVHLVPGAALRHTQRVTEVETLLLGQRPSFKLFEAAGQKMAEVMIAVSGRRWSTPYKEPVIATLTQRALTRIFLQDDDQEDEVLVTMEHLHRETEHPVAAQVPDEDEHPHPQVRHEGTPQTIEMTLNGKPVTVEAPVGISLLTLLRDYLGMLGAKEGCNGGECGACTVIMDGEAVLSCMVLAHQAGGCNVITIEGIRGPDGGLNDLQQAFIDYGAVQCGMCIPGMIMSAEALLARTLTPSRREIRYAIAGNLCRCTGYQQIVDAIEATAARRRAGRPNVGD